MLRKYSPLRPLYPLCKCAYRNGPKDENPALVTQPRGTSLLSVKSAIEIQKNLAKREENKRNSIEENGGRTVAYLAV